jgi:hypothetical protein
MKDTVSRNSLSVSSISRFSIATFRSSSGISWQPGGCLAGHVLTCRIEPSLSLARLQSAVIQAEDRKLQQFNIGQYDSLLLHHRRLAQREP